MMNQKNKFDLVKLILISLTFLLLIVIVFFPVLNIFIEAFSAGLTSFWNSITEHDTLHAMYLTLLSSFVSLPFNVAFGVSFAYLVTRYDFWGKSFLISLLDFPFFTSPVIAGMLVILLYGKNGVLGNFLESIDLKIVFNTPGIIIATTFITMSYIAKELIPLMQSLGTEEEEAGIALGANGWQVFKLITLPNIKWGLIYGITLAYCRALGEFGAVSVVSGHIRGMTNTMPLQIETMYNEYNSKGAFAVASVLFGLSLITLALKKLIEIKYSPLVRK